MSKVPRMRKSASKDAPRLSFFHILSLILLIGIIFGLGVLVKGVYRDHWTSGSVRALTKIVPVPAASVNGEMVFYDDVAALSALTEATDDDEEDPFAAALEVAIRRKHVEQFAEQFGIDGDQLLKESTEKVDQELLQQLGWSEKMYRRHILRPLLIAQALEREIYASEVYQRPARQRMEGIVNDIELGVDFTDLAIQHSEGGAAPAGGDIGYVKRDELDQGLEDLFDLEVEKYSDILESDTYFAVGYAYDAIEVEEEREQVGLQIITINKQTLAEALEAYIPEQEVKVFVR